MSENRVEELGGASASINFVRPSQLTEEHVDKTIVQGVFVETLRNQYDESKLDYKFENEDGSVSVLNGAGNLGFRMQEANVGDLIEVVYLGKQEISKGRMKGKQAHNFKVLRHLE